MRLNVQEFVKSLLDHARTSLELEVMLNFNHELSSEIWSPGQRQTLERLKLAIKYKQKGVIYLLLLYKYSNLLKILLHSLWPIPMFNSYWLPFGMRVYLVFDANKPHNK